MQKRVSFLILACVVFAVVQSVAAPPYSGNGSFSVPAAQGLPGSQQEPSIARAMPVEPPVASSYTTVDENYTLRPGDRISFSVEEDRKPPIELTVMASGEVEIPRIGRFSVVGRTCRAVGAMLKAHLERQYYKQATVTVALNQAAAVALQGTANIRVYFNGAVAVTGAREFPPDGRITVSKAILIAGGFRDFANRNKVQLIRKSTSGTSQVITVKVGDLLKGKSGPDPVVQAEDMIYVPEKLINF